MGLLRQYRDGKRAALDANIYTHIVNEWQGKLASFQDAPQLAQKMAGQAWLSGSIAPRVAKLAQVVQDGDTQAARLLAEMADTSPLSVDDVPDAPAVSERFVELVTNGTRCVPSYIGPLDRGLGGSNGNVKPYWRPDRG